MTVMQLYSGVTWDILKPSKTDISWNDIAHSLGNICRFNGHCTKFYSVAEHCCRVAEILPIEYRLYGLLHDAHEAFIGDISTPLKIAFNGMGMREVINELAETHDIAIHHAAGLQWPPPKDIKDLIKFADLKLLATERRDLMNLAYDNKIWQLPFPLNDKIVPWKPREASKRWLTEVNNLIGGCNEVT